MHHNHIFMISGGMNMKKITALLLAAALSAGLTACGSSGRKTGEIAQEEREKLAQAQVTASAVPSGSPEPQIILKYAELNNANSFITQVGYQFSEYVKELSNGRIKIEVLPGNSLANDRAFLMAQKESTDIIDMYRSNTNTLVGVGFKKLNLFALPYIFKDREGMWKVLEDENLGRAFLSEGMEIGVGLVGLFYTDEGPRNLVTIPKIKGLKDIQKKKIRVPESVLMMDILSALGAQPFPMPYEELFKALESGLVEGAENPLSSYYSTGMYKVAPYYMFSEHIYSPGVVFIAEKKWKDLSKADQEILLEAGRKTVEWNKREIVEEEKRLRTVL